MRELQWIKFLLWAHGLVCLMTLGATASDEDVWQRGRQLVIERGCLGCHKIGSQGGNLGPDITYAGDKAVRDLDFTRVEGERTVANWMFAYFKSPASALPGAVKPDLGLSDDEARALAEYMIRLKREAGHAVGIPLPRPLEGKALYGAFCSACHGANGQGGIVRAPDDFRTRNRPGESIAPALANPDTLGVASDDFLRMTIRRGRSGTGMPAWADEGGLSENDISQLVAHIRSWDGIAPSIERISASRGNVRYGGMLYRSRCAGCHGRNERDRIGVSLHSASLLAVASDDFLARTIVYGRANTSMPSWKQLSADEVSDLLAYIRGWENAPADKQEVLEKVAQRKAVAESLRIGEVLYQSKCAACHGHRGQGILGPSLNKDAFLSVADDEYLYAAIVEGRPGTAMPAWKHLSADDLVGLITFLRSWNNNRRRRLEAYSSQGDRNRGRIVFQRTCAECHGRDAEGATGPQLGNPLFLALATDAMLREWIVHRCPRTETRSAEEVEQETAELSGVQIGDVVTYLRRLRNAVRPPITHRATGNIDRGRTLYDFVCAECHGPNGEGLTGSALSNPDFLRSASDGFLLASIVVGRDGTRMRPDITKILSVVGRGNAHTALEDIVAFIRHWERNPPIAGVPARYVTGIDADAGKELYASYCAGCHGKRGDDGWATTLNNREFLAAANDGFLQATVMRGRAGTAMRPFAIGSDGIGELTRGEVNNIVAHLRSWAAPENRATKPR